jgi:hypothetical protein
LLGTSKYSGAALISLGLIDVIIKGGSKQLADDVVEAKSNLTEYESLIYMNMNVGPFSICMTQYRFVREYKVVFTIQLLVNGSAHWLVRASCSM